MMPGIMPTVWRCRLGLGHKAPGHRCSSQPGALGEFRGADPLPRDHPHPWMQLFSTALHCTPARWSCRFIAHAPSNRGQALLGARAFPGELNPLLSLGHLCLAGILLFSLCCGGEQDLGTPYPEPSTLPEGSTCRPFPTHTSQFLRLLTPACAKTGLGEGRTRSALHKHCTGAVPQASLGHQLGSSCAQGHVCCPVVALCARAGSRSHPHGLAGRATSQGSDIPECWGRAYARRAESPRRDHPAWTAAPGNGAYMV